MFPLHFLGDNLGDFQGVMGWEHLPEMDHWHGSWDVGISLLGS